MNAILNFTASWRAGSGFDDLLDVMGRAIPQDAALYPAYNIERTGEDTLRLTLALAGWTPGEITVTAEPNLLVVSGEKAEAEDDWYLYRGIPSGAFERRFSLGDYVQVSQARMANGLLTIDLARELPEALKPRRIQIENSVKPVLEHKEAA